MAQTTYTLTYNKADWSYLHNNGGCRSAYS